MSTSMAKTNLEHQRDFLERQRQRGRVRLQFWVSKAGSRGYLMSRQAGNHDEIGKALVALTESGLLKMIIDKPFVIEQLTKYINAKNFIASEPIVWPRSL